MRYSTTIPDTVLVTNGFRPGFGTVSPSDYPTDTADIFSYKLRDDGVAIVRWEAPDHMKDEYLLEVETGRVVDIKVYYHE
jgi:hypothetical protein